MLKGRPFMDATSVSKPKDEGGRMKDEKGSIRSSSSFSLHPSSFP
jgi:hypothetical protein